MFFQGGGGIPFMFPGGGMPGGMPFGGMGREDDEDEGSRKEVRSVANCGGADAGTHGGGGIHLRRTHQRTLRPWSQQWYYYHAVNGGAAALQRSRGRRLPGAGVVEAARDRPRMRPASNQP
jgi:hypothetical protein